jgi:phosphoglycolate phosphatase
MCEHAGIEVPDEDACYGLACETEEYVMPRVRAEFPGAGEAIRSLRGAGFRLGTASGHPSRDLEGILATMGVREHFADRLYGPDLVGVLKNGPEYYRRIFADTGVPAAEALTVDDSPRAVAWATAAGARAVLVSSDALVSRTDALVIHSLAGLPALLEA